MKVPGRGPGCGGKGLDTGTGWGNEQAGGAGRIRWEGRDVGRVKKAHNQSKKEEIYFARF